MDEIDKHDFERRKLQREIAGIVGQWFAAVTVVVGCGIEVAYKAHVGFICITLGSLIFAIATKIKYYRR